MNTEAVNGVRGKGNFKAKQQQGAALAAKFAYEVHARSASELNSALKSVMADLPLA